MMVLDQINLDKISTKAFADVLKRFEVENVLILIDEANPAVELSARNIPSVKVLRAEGVNVYDLMKYHSLVLTQGAVSQLEGALEK